MVINPKDAKQFINSYTSLLAEVHILSDGARKMELLEMLSAARDAVVANPLLLDLAALSLEGQGRPLPEDVLDAVRSLKVRQWIFLRDTTKYSIFIEPDGKEAYAVLGLTERLRDIVGGTGVVLRTGVVRFRGVYVCDGLVANPVWIGANYKREYSEILTSIKKSGRFYEAKTMESLTETPSTVENRAGSGGN